MPQIDIDGANSRLSADNIRGQSGSTITIVSGHSLSGSGSGLTALNATQLTSGTLPMARLSGTLPALNGSALTNLPAHSGNVVFPASQSASSNANTLDDYEEGSWTPALKFGGASASMTYTTQSGTYTKIGRICHFQFRITLNALGSSTGAASITGWPFSANGGAGEQVLMWHSITAIGMPGSTRTSIKGNLSGGTCQIRAYGDDVAQSSLTNSDFASSDDFSMAGVFYI